MKTLEPINSQARSTLENMTQKRPVYLVARDLRMSNCTVTRALSGLPVSQGTRVLLEIRLKEVTAGNVALVETNTASF